MRAAGAVLLAVVIGVAALAPWLAPNPPDRRFSELLYAPPTRIHFGPSPGEALSLDNRGLHVHRWRVVNRLERTFEEVRDEPAALRWFTREALVTAAAERGAPLLLLGADAYGRDVLARLLHATRTTLLLALVSVVLTVLLGTLLGGVAGLSSGWVDGTVSRLSEFVLVLPAIYVALALRAVMPLVLAPGAVFVLLGGIFTLLGWPIVARGVRAIVRAEREREYAEAACALGAGPARLLFRHLLPAARGYLATQATLLLPAFILAEATLSYVGLGFPDSTPTWGTLLQEATNIALVEDAPWLLAPAGAIFIVGLAANLLVQGAGRAPVQLER